MLKMLSAILIVILMAACSDGEATESKSAAKETETPKATETDTITESETSEEIEEESEEVVEEEDEELTAQEILDLTADEWLAYSEDDRQVLMSKLIFELKQEKGWSFKYTDREYLGIVSSLLGEEEKGSDKTVSETMGLLMLMEGNK
ncbi:hypothetical protein [Halobacillus salinus]|uniref:hypothetical protein n=1 Tax=Halobacillus salinus TaxID=192814 RepID=UPI0009A5D961|nr:hypothetical protein [Halobacillus salinus]